MLSKLCDVQASLCEERKEDALRRSVSQTVQSHIGAWETTYRRELAMDIVDEESTKLGGVFGLCAVQVND